MSRHTDEPLNIPISLRVDRTTAKLIQEERGNLHTGQFVRMVLQDAMRIRRSARSRTFEALVGPRTFRGRPGNHST